MSVARILEDHPMVVEVFYPVLDSYLDRDMADSTFQYGRYCMEDHE